MEKQQFKTQLTAYINNNIDLSYLIDKIVNSGCIDFAKENNYLLVKAAASAIFKHLSIELGMITTEGKKETENIYKFL